MKDAQRMGCKTLTKLSQTLTKMGGEGVKTLTRG